MRGGRGDRGGQGHTAVNEISIINILLRLRKLTGRALERSGHEVYQRRDRAESVLEHGLVDEHAELFLGQCAGGSSGVREGENEDTRGK